MTIEYEIKMEGLGYDWAVDGDAEASVTIDDYDGGERTLYFHLDDLEKVVALLRRHSEAYEAYKDSGYEDEDAYHRVMSNM